MVKEFLQPAIVVITYNRPASLRRLLKSVVSANFDSYQEVTLIISIDGGASGEVLEVAESLVWKYGKKVIIQHPGNLGLRKHVVSCGDFTHEYGSVILLEDDLLVSPNFFDYSVQALNFYHDEPFVAGISLYSVRLNENIYLPFEPLYDGNEVFFLQVPASSGQAWSEKQWSSFKQFYEGNPVIGNDDRLPSNVKAWPESSWKKYFYKYIVDRNLYFVYPQHSYSTNSGDPGQHFDLHVNYLQVALVNGLKNVKLKFIDFMDGKVKYDAYFELLPECLNHYGIDGAENCLIDLYGTKQQDLFTEEYMYSVRKCEKVISGFGITLHPLVNNVIMNNEGETISFGKRKDFHDGLVDKTVLLSSTDSYVFAYTQQYMKESLPYKTGKYMLNPGLLWKRLIRVFR